MRMVQALSTLPGLQVTFLAVTRHLQVCQEGMRAQIDSQLNVDYRCLDPQHLSPPEVYLLAHVLQSSHVSEGPYGFQVSW